MKYEEFTGYIRDGISSFLDDKQVVAIHKVIKNNDVELDALTINSSDYNVSPTIYLNPYYDEYCNGKDKQEIVSEIYSLYEEYNEKIEFDVDAFMNYESIKSTIVFKIINSGCNEKLLLDVPHIDYLDLSIVFYCIVDNEYIGHATVLIHNSHLTTWNVDIDTLFSTAKLNSTVLLEPDIKNMHEVMHEMLVIDMEKRLINGDDSFLEADNNTDISTIADSILNDMTTSPIDMYVLTNKSKLFGASCILYTDVLKNFANKIKSNLFILPSSIHEVILVPEASNIASDELSNMVKSVNLEEVDEGDVLSDHVYYYDRFSCSITIPSC